ncbi:hypothetical protein AB1A64_00020 [Ruegeria sp. ANG10]|uniref:hypothetical protein n=1 Tax=Ruegeria sp. ANG10 TaxID=3042467 RepID=UPI0034553071
MAKSFWQFWLFLIPGIAVSYLISIFSHDLMGIPRGVPFGRFGVAGTVAQISLMLLPFAIGAFVSAILYFRRFGNHTSGRQIVICATMIGLIVLVVTLLFFAFSGAWFGLLQAPNLKTMLIFLFAPCLSAATLFLVVFPTTIWLITLWRSLG